MKQIILNTEYTYSQICEVLGWKKYSGGDSKKAQIKEIESSFEWEHPINEKTHKEKKSYIFTKQLKEPVAPKHGGSNNNKNIDPMMDYLCCIANGIDIDNSMTLTRWFCSGAGLNLMNPNICDEQFGSDEALVSFCAEHYIEDINLFRTYMGIIRKNTKDIFLKALAVMAKKGLVEYIDGYEFYYKMKHGCVGNVFTDELNDTVHNLEKKNCEELNDVYRFSEKMTGRQLLMLIYRKPEVKKKFDEFMNVGLNVTALWDILNPHIDEEHLCACRINENHKIQSYYRAVHITGIEEKINPDCNKDDLATTVTNVIRRVSRRELFNKKWTDYNGVTHHSYNIRDSATDVLAIEKLLFTHFDKDFDDGTSLNLVAQDDELMDDVSSQNGKADNISVLTISTEDKEELNRLFDRVSIA